MSSCNRSLFFLVPLLITNSLAASQYPKQKSKGQTVWQWAKNHVEEIGIVALGLLLSASYVLTSGNNRPAEPVTPPRENPNGESQSESPSHTVLAPLSPWNTDRQAVGDHADQKCEQLTQEYSRERIPFVEHTPKELNNIRPQEDKAIRITPSDNQETKQQTLSAVSSVTESIAPTTSLPQAVGKLASHYHQLLNVLRGATLRLLATNPSTRSFATLIRR